MKRYNITVNGKAYDVAVEEVGGSAAAAPVAAAPVAAAPAAGGAARALRLRRPAAVGRAVRQRDAGAAFARVGRRTARGYSRRLAGNAQQAP